MPSAGKGFADEMLVFSRHDLEERALAGAVRAEHADLGAGQKREPDVAKNLGIGRVDLPQPLHGVNELHVCGLMCRAAFQYTAQLDRGPLPS